MFANRIDAGRQLAGRLSALRAENVVVLGLPRGGVPVAAEVAKALDAPLDVIVVRKLGLPLRPELAMGALGENGVRVIDDAILRVASVTAGELRLVERRETARLHERVQLFRRGHDRIDLSSRIVVIVDDGIATGSTSRAACAVARRLGAARIILAAPVAPRRVVNAVPEADEVVVVLSPIDFTAVGYHYREFSPTTEQDVVAALDEAARRITES